MASCMARALPTASPPGSKATMAARPTGMDVEGTTAMCRGAHAGGLLGGEDDVAVVGQQHDLVGAERLDRLEQLRGARVHRLAAVDDGVAAELAEERLVALAGDHGHHDGALGEPAR